MVAATTLSMSAPFLSLCRLRRRLLLLLPLLLRLLLLLSCSWSLLGYGLRGLRSCLPPRPGALLHGMLCGAAVETPTVRHLQLLVNEGTLSAAVAALLGQEVVADLLLASTLARW